MNQVLLFNPQATRSKPRIPNSVLQVAASIDAEREWVIVDGNRDADPWEKIRSYLATGKFKYLGMTVMPGPQLQQAIPFVRRVRAEFPGIINIWGGYFASNQYKAVMESGYVDYIVDGPGDKAFPALLNALENGEDPALIRNLIFRRDGEVYKTPREDLLDQNALPDLPYDKLHDLYDMKGYLPSTWLGKRTIAYHSSVGCPFTCSFCAVVPIYNARWKGRSAEKIFKDVMYMRDTYGGDSVEFHDNNFFVSRKRTVEFARLMKDQGMIWWGEGRIDTMDKYTDDDLALMSESGCKIIFFGAETGNDDVLAQMDKGGTQSGAQIKEFAGRLRKFGIVPEYSFVLGLPADTPEQVMAQIDSDIAFIKEIKEINPDTEIIIYVYSPVPTEGSELFEKVTASGFSFPQKLEDWLDPAWEKFDLRKNPLTPWLKPEMVDRIRNFETVLNARYPSASDIKLSSFQRKVMRSLSSMRYRTGFYHYPYEIKALQKFWLRYRQPEIEGA
jgi:anaerobic magnesium-protoporphyrin IX monomethyl ester cyclase